MQIRRLLLLLLPLVVVLAHESRRGKEGEARRAIPESEHSSWKGRSVEPESLLSPPGRRGRKALRRNAMNDAIFHKDEKDKLFKKGKTSGTTPEPQTNLPVIKTKSLLAKTSVRLKGPDDEDLFVGARGKFDKDDWRDESRREVEEPQIPSDADQVGSVEGGNKKNDKKDEKEGDKQGNKETDKQGNKEKGNAAEKSDADEQNETVARNFDEDDANESFSPTINPTRKPTRHPTFKPTPPPSVMPSFRPTPKPSRLPSRSPTPYPSLEPFFVPTRHPTPRPTSLPNKHPTPTPSLSPRVKITKVPTLLPTIASAKVLETSEPSSKAEIFPPTTAPTYSLAPQNQPSAMPTTSQPTTTEPTAHPTFAPSSHPTALPTSPKPSSAPSAVPSFHPSTDPSLAPSPIPSPSPTQRPSRIPSTVPSMTPSSSPSSIPTAMPTTSFPSLVPSSVPSQETDKLPVGTISIGFSILLVDGIHEARLRKPGDEVRRELNNATTDLHDDGRKHLIRSSDLMDGSEPEIAASVRDAVLDALCGNSTDFDMVSPPLGGTGARIDLCIVAVQRTFGGHRNRRLQNFRPSATTKLEAPSAAEGSSNVTDGSTTIDAEDENFVRKLNWLEWRMSFDVRNVGKRYFRKSSFSDRDGEWQGNPSAKAVRGGNAVVDRLELLPEAIENVNAVAQRAVWDSILSGSFEFRLRQMDSRIVAACPPGMEKTAFGAVVVGANLDLPPVGYVKQLDPNPVNVVRIFGVLMFFGTIAGVLCLGITARRRQRERQWDHEFKVNRQGGLVTPEGLDLMLEVGRQNTMAAATELRSTEGASTAAATPEKEIDTAEVEAASRESNQAAEVDAASRESAHAVEVEAASGESSPVKSASGRLGATPAPETTPLSGGLRLVVRAREQENPPARPFVVDGETRAKVLSVVSSIDFPDESHRASGEEESDDSSNGVESSPARNIMKSIISKHADRK